MTQPALRVQDLSLRWPQAPEREVLQRMSLDVAAAAWTAVLGPNGAGKSSLLKCLAALLPHQGRVDWRGPAGMVSPQSLSATQRAQHLSWLGNTPLSNDDLRVYDVAMLGRLPHQPWWGAASAQDHAAVQTALQQVDMWPLRERSVGQLSSGERQRVLLARAWAVQAPITLLDEPLAHLDPPHQSDVLRHIRHTVQQGRTVVSVLHEVGLALWADHIVLLREGRLVYSGPSADPATHRAIEAVFDQRLQIVPVQAEGLHGLDTNSAAAKAASDTPHTSPAPTAWAVIPC